MKSSGQITPKVKAARDALMERLDAEWAAENALLAAAALPIAKKTECDKCIGAGEIYADRGDTIVCPKCKGTGKPE